MTASLVNMRRPESDARLKTLPVYGGEHILRGAAVGITTSGYLRMMVSGVALKPQGVAIQEVDNTNGSSGDLLCDCLEGAYWFLNSSRAPVTVAHVQSAGYFDDNQTVASDSNSGASNNGGRILAVDSKEGVLLATGALFSVDGDMVAANNLSDVLSASTARANIGANKYCITFQNVSSKASDSAVAYMPVPIAGTIVRMTTVIDAALATADATVQLQYGANAGALANVGSTTTGKATLTQAGSAAGDVHAATPLTTNLSVAEDGLLKIIIGGGSTATGNVRCVVEIAY